MPWYSRLRELAHAALAILAALGLSAGVIATSLDAFGVHVSSMQISGFLTAASALVLVASKLIDSVNNAWVTWAANRGGGGGGTVVPLPQPPAGVAPPAEQQALMPAAA